jgi:hypothetical protein
MSDDRPQCSKDDNLLSSHAKCASGSEQSDVDADLHKPSPRGRGAILAIAAADCTQKARVRDPPWRRLGLLRRLAIALTLVDQVG